MPPKKAPHPDPFRNPEQFVQPVADPLDSLLSAADSLLSSVRGIHVAMRAKTEWARAHQLEGALAIAENGLRVLRHQTEQAQRVRDAVGART